MLVVAMVANRALWLADAWIGSHRTPGRYQFWIQQSSHWYSHAGITAILRSGTSIGGELRASNWLLDLKIAGTIGGA